MSTSRSSAVAEAATKLAGLLLIASLHVDEAGRSYTYDTVNEKLFVPDADACEICEEAADLGWIDDEATYEGVFGDEDGPPLHPHCGCELQYRERRVRVYESGALPKQRRTPLQNIGQKVAG
jgi:hypothetical protein